MVAANRDEFLRRPAVGPTVLLDQPRAVGGLDLEARGSWFGVTAGGLLALLTNQPEPDGRPHPGRRSRGEIVMGALERGGRDAARAWLAELDGRQYNSFNLLFGDAEVAEVAYGRSDRRELEFEPVPDGLSVLPNGRLDQPGHVKVARARGWSSRRSARRGRSCAAPWPPRSPTTSASRSSRCPSGTRRPLPARDDPRADRALHPHAGVRHAVGVDRPAGAG